MEYVGRTSYRAEKVRIVAREHGLNWDAMTEEEREIFIDNVLHEA